jgi:hypothetical protein
MSADLRKSRKSANGKPEAKATSYSSAGVTTKPSRLAPDAVGHRLSVVGSRSASPGPRTRRRRSCPAELVGYLPRLVAEVGGVDRCSAASPCVVPGRAWPCRRGFHLATASRTKPKATRRGSEWEQAAPRGRGHQAVGSRRLRARRSVALARAPHRGCNVGHRLTVCHSAPALRQRHHLRIQLRLIDNNDPRTRRSCLIEVEYVADELLLRGYAQIVPALPTPSSRVKAIP